MGDAVRKWALIGGSDGPTCCLRYETLPGLTFRYPDGWPHGELIWYATFRETAQGVEETTPWRQSEQRSGGDGR